MTWERWALLLTLNEVIKMKHIGATKNAIMIIISSSMDIQKNPYSKASVNKIIELLKQYHGITVKRRWVFYCLHDLEEEGLIARKPRYKNIAPGRIKQMSSMIVFTLKGAKYLIKKKVIGAMQLMKRILDWMKNQDKRFPTNPVLTDAGRVEMDPGDARRFFDLAARVLKPI